MDLSIIIVSWNVREKLKDNLRALYESQNVDFEIFVVDNNSADGTALMIKKDYPRVNLITNSENLGFARANNQAIKLAMGRYILLLNPDMRVFDDTLSSMISWLDRHDEAWVTGCRLIDESARIIKHVRRFPGVFDQLAVILKIPHLLPGILNNYLRSDFDYAKSAQVDSIRGGFFMIRREALEKIGLLDERYFLWFEEVDYCKRVKRGGGQVWYMPNAECIDLMGQSFKQVNLAVKQRYFRDSMLKYFKKWQPSYEYWTLRLAWPLGISITWLVEKLAIPSKAKT